MTFKLLSGAVRCGGAGPMNTLREGAESKCWKVNSFFFGLGPRFNDDGHGWWRWRRGWAIQFHRLAGACTCSIFPASLCYSLCALWI